MASSPAPQIRITDFSDKLMEKTVYFKLMVLQDSFYVWIGTEPQLSNMAVAMPARFDNIPSVATILGNKTEEMSAALSLKLAKKYKQQVFVSCSVPFDPQLSLLIEKKLVEELKKTFPS